MNTAEITQNTLKASFLAIVQAFCTDLLDGRLSTAQYRLKHVEELAGYIDDEWYRGKVPTYRARLQELGWGI